MNGNRQPQEIGGWGTLKKYQRPMIKGGSQKSVRVTLAETHRSGDIEPDRDTNPPSKLSTQNLSSIKEMQRW